MTKANTDRHADEQWGIVQACIWISYRSDDLVRRIAAPGALPSNTAIPSDSLYSAFVFADTHAASLDLTGQVESAPAELQKRCAAAELVMHGRRDGKGRLAPIPREEWPTLEILSSSNAPPLRAASADGKEWWDRLSVSAADVRRIWPEHEIYTQRDMVLEDVGKGSAEMRSAAAPRAREGLSESRGEMLHGRIREWKQAKYPDGTAKPQGQLATECAQALGLKSLSPRTYRRALGGQ